jgi:hypothetical protein
VIEADFYQPFADGKRDETLRRLTRNAHLGGDLFLRIASNVVKPAGAGGIIKPGRSVLVSGSHSYHLVPRAIIAKHAIAASAIDAKGQVSRG